VTTYQVPSDVNGSCEVAIRNSGRLIGAMYVKFEICVGKSSSNLCHRFHKRDERKSLKLHILI
jgi:hypothetical protein